MMAIPESLPAPCAVPQARERGSALLAVLWMSAALAAIAFSVASTVRSETDRASTSADGLRTYYLASGSVERAIQWMLWGWDNPGVYHNPDGSPRFWSPNMPRMIMHFPSGDAVVEMIPEASKLDINTATPDQLYRVVLAVSGDPDRAREIAGAIVDWRSPAGPDSLDPLYLLPTSSAIPTFRPRHASFQEIEELLLVRGVTPELFYGNFVTDEDGRLYARGGLRDSLSVWGSKTGPYDINTASPALMQALGVPAGGVEQIVQRRTVQPFKTMREASALGFPLPGLGVGGNYIWTLRASARLRLPDGSSSDLVRTAAATVKLLDTKQYPQMPLHVLRYYDDAWSQSELVPPKLPPGTPPPPGGVVQ
jgi:general secretion pathway protein K